MLITTSQQMGGDHPADNSVEGSSVLSIPSMNDLDTQNRRYLDPGAVNKNLNFWRWPCVLHK